MPDRAIPELRLLTEEDWYELAKEPIGLVPDAFDLLTRNRLEWPCPPHGRRRKTDWHGSIIEPYTVTPRLMVEEFQMPCGNFNPI